MKKKTKPTSVRLDEELLNEIDQRCSKVGCTRNDFIKNSVGFIFNQSSDFDFGDEEEETDEEPEKPQVKITLIEKEEPKPIVMAHGKILDDFGNVVGTF